MSPFSRKLKKTRLALGHRTARAGFDWFKSKGVSFNYSYYMQLEKEGVPSAAVAQEMASVLKGETGDQLLLAYCRSLFPKHTYLFPESVTATAAAPNPPEPTDKTYAPAGQRELSPRQVAAIAASQAHYHFFLLSTLARRPVPTAELSKWFSSREISSVTRDLQKAGLIRATPEGFEAVSVEMRFPAADNKGLKDAYAQFDAWDEKFGDQFALDFILNKMLIRRVSTRYLVIIRHQLEVLFELVRSADETDLRFNEKVLQMKVVLRQGNLPG